MTDHRPIGYIFIKCIFRGNTFGHGFRDHRPVIKTAREEEPDLFDDDLKAQIVQMMSEAVDCEVAFAEDTLSGGVAGLSIKDMRQYLEYCADQRMAQLGMPKHFGSSNPFPFMDLQDVQELTNFFERRVSAYQVGVQGEVGFDHAF